ncbi:MAG TPA: DUF1015 domain-containing protein [Clostridiaceae bacterium]|nr:DUF1015 domain-containing protein [Clostridiaceae bacterium]
MDAINNDKNLSFHDTSLKLLETVGVKMPEVLLPNKSIDMTKWAVIACDQYTSQPEYWEQVQNIVGDNPSALSLILPEVYLEKPDVDERIDNINMNMQTYLDNGTLVSQNPCFIYVDRKTSHVPSRKGLILLVDLEKYDYNEGSQTLIRATEKTVIERLPPRVKIRKNALIELPHILLLIDDPKRTVIEPLAEKTDSMEKLYDFELMMNGGHIKGYKIEDTELINSIASALCKLAQPEVFYKKYGVSKEKRILLFAVGDGNHSLASAKVHWENIKAGLSHESPEKLAEALENHPARYAMAEVINVHDEGLIFEPIHRVLFNVDCNDVIENMKAFFSKYSPVDFKIYSSINDMLGDEKRLRASRAGAHILPFISKDFLGSMIIEKPIHNLDVATLQEFLDKYLEQNKNVKIDYIHGDDIVTDLGLKEGNMGFYLPSINKHELFRTVILDGTLPRKTFSMGEAEEKRYYIECRKIKA